MIKYIFASLLLALSLSVPAGAAPLASPPLSEQDKADIDRVETYLGGITTLKATFLQGNPDGSVSGGTMLIQRPGKMRIDYSAPLTDFMVADGTMLNYWDGEMKAPSSVPLGSTLADFILRDKIRLADDVTVTGVGRTSGMLEISLVQTKEPAGGQLTLVFTDRPLDLRQWRIVDAGGQITRVSLMDKQTGVTFDRDLFRFTPPSFGKSRFQ
jgi:outer membrane lipoprotein-sorting protein